MLLTEKDEFELWSAGKLGGNWRKTEPTETNGRVP
jgi:hypothetical protein